MNDFKKYRRKNFAEMREWRGEDITGVSISKTDLGNGSPRKGDMVARNPLDHDDQWLVAAKYFKENFEPLDPDS